MVCPSFIQLSWLSSILANVFHVEVHFWIGPRTCPGFNPLCFPLWPLLHLEFEPQCRSVCYGLILGLCQKVNTWCLRRQIIHLRWEWSRVGYQSRVRHRYSVLYLTIIGILRWIIKLGRINIITKVSLLSSHVALLREGHLEAAINVLAHVGQRYNSRLVYGPL